MLNDAHLCDAPIRYPPQLLALGCLVYAVAMDRGTGEQQQQQQGQGHQNERPSDQQQLQQHTQQPGEAGAQLNGSGASAMEVDGQQQEQQPQAGVTFSSWLRGLEVDLAMVRVGVKCFMAFVWGC